MNHKIIEMFIDILYPRSCPICKSPLGIKSMITGSTICPKCVSKVFPIGSNKCMKCGKELESEESEYCYDCTRIKHIFEQGTAAFTYSEGIKQSIYRFKYEGCREYAEWYGRAIKEHCGNQIIMWNPDVIIPVPLNSHKQKQRGYNQAALIAENLSKVMNIPIDEKILIRTKKTMPMKALDDNERIKNISNAFKVREKLIKYKKVVLVDDIYTTGATMDECAMALKKSGVQKVYCVSLCIGRGI